jgi:hypothetical protein
MKSSWFFSVLLLFLLGACINGEQTFRADYTHLLSSGNSKVWMLSASQLHEQDALQKNAWGEVLFVFYITGEVLVGSFGDLDKGTFDKGHFQYDENKQELRIQIKAESWKFKLDVVNEEKLVLQTISGQDLAAYLHLVPLTVPH